MSSGMITLILIGICIGVAATVTMDVLGSIARKIGLSAGVKGQCVGRWYLGIVRGKFLHTNIEAFPDQPGEKWAALVGHYTIGTTLAVFYFIVAGWLGVSAGSFLIAVGYGLATCVFPWFLVFPALGFGFFGLKGPKELRLLTSSLMNHLFYGFGLWWVAKVAEMP